MRTARISSNIPPLIAALLLLATVPVWAAPGSNAPADLQSISPSELGPESHYPDIARRMARYFPREHLTRATLDQMVAARAWTNYLSSLDYDKVYFREEDIDSFRKQQAHLGTLLGEGEVGFAYDVFAVLRERATERHLFVKKLLTEGFDFSVDETFRWQRKDAQWARTREEYDELWRLKVKNEYLAELLSAEIGEHEEQEGRSTTPDREVLSDYRQFVSVLEDGDSEWIFQKYLSAFAQAYDPHSDYMSPSSLEDFDIEMKLSLVGIGALLRPEDGAVRIVRVIPGGPAAKDQRDIRLRRGDRIVAVGQGDGNQVDVKHWPLYKVVRLIRGEKGSEVVLTIESAADPAGGATRDVSLIRDEVQLEQQAVRSKALTIKDSNGTDHKLTVVTLPAFYADFSSRAGAADDGRRASSDMKRALQKAVQNSSEGILLDLRNNGGGALLEAVAIAGQFISSGPTVQVKERYRTKALYDKDPSIVYAGPVVVLVNRLSASAAEIVAGALQDYGRAIIVGDSRTHGKGTVQRILPIGRDIRMGAAKITESMYFRVSGASTQLKGVVPDIVISSPYEYMELGEDQLPGALAWSKVRKIKYDQAGDLSYIIAAVKAKSVERRSAAPAFTEYGELLERVKKLRENKEITLRIEDRRKLAPAAKEIEEIFEQLSLEHSGVDDENDRVDVVKDEGLRILADFAGWWYAMPQAARPEPRGRSVGESVLDWLRMLL